MILVEFSGFFASCLLSVISQHSDGALICRARHEVNNQTSSLQFVRGHGLRSPTALFPAELVSGPLGLLPSLAPQALSERHRHRQCSRPQYLLLLAPYWTAQTSREGENDAAVPENFVLGEGKSRGGENTTGARVRSADTTSTVTPRGSAWPRATIHRIETLGVSP